MKDDCSPDLTAGMTYDIITGLHPLCPHHFGISKVLRSFYLSHMGQDSAVSIGTRYRLDGPGIESWLGRDFLHSSRPTLGHTQPPVQWVSGIPRSKAGGAWRWSPPPPSADIEEREVLYLYSPPGPSRPVLRWTSPSPTSVTWQQLLGKQTNTWHLYCCDCRNTPIYAHKTSRKLPTCDICLGLSNVTCAWSWRLGGINPVIPHNWTCVTVLWAADDTLT
jgi:hypothetical protein